MSTTVRRAIVRLAAVTLPVVMVACISGHDESPTAGQIIGPVDSTGGGGGGGGTGGNLVGLYHLTSFNGATLPDTIVADSVTPSTDPGADSSRKYIVVLDSAELILNTDSTASETDFFQLTDQRSSQVTPLPAFAFSTIGGGGTDSVPCTGSTFSATVPTGASFALRQMSCTNYGFQYTMPGTTYSAAHDTLVGTVFYQFFDSAATRGWPVYSGTPTLVWKFFSLPPAGGQHAIAAPGKAAMRQSRRIVIQRH
jgi:hypothetical protein